MRRARWSGSRATRSTARKCEAIGGRGVAAELVERLVADARKQDFLIRPDCSYVAKKFEENDWDAVRA